MGNVFGPEMTWYRIRLAMPDDSFVLPHQCIPLFKSLPNTR